MLPLIERLELSRRYSRRRDDFASRFAHGYVLEFFLKATGSAGYSLRPTQNTGLSRGMAESGKLGKHTRSWRDVSVIGDDGNSNSSRYRGHWNSPLMRTHRASAQGNNQTGIRSPIFPNRQNAGITDRRAESFARAATRPRAHVDAQKGQDGSAFPRRRQCALC
jgi:hypothetical protein